MTAAAQASSSRKVGSTASRTSCTPGGTVLDLGCGPGKPMAAYLMTQGFDICGVDSSPTMIALCRENFPERQWFVADMRTLDLGRCFEGIMAWDSFFHLSFDDQRRDVSGLSAHMPPPARRFCSPAAHATARPSARCAASRSITQALIPTNTARCWPPTTSRSSPSAWKTRNVAAIRCGWRAVPKTAKSLPANFRTE